MAKIGIVLPVYQAERTLRRCLESVLRQSLADFTLYAVNDGSRDHSGVILDRYAGRDARLVVIHQQNAGVAKARNRALERMQQDACPYVTFIDSDDWWEPDTLRRMLSAMDACNADIVQCHFRYVSQSGQSYAPRLPFGNRRIIERADFPATVYRRMLIGMTMNHVHHTMYRAVCVENLRMPGNLRTCEDLSFNLYAYARARRYAYVPDVCYHYFRRPDSLTGSGLPMRVKFECNRAVAREMRRVLPLWGMDTPVYRALCGVRPYLMIVSKLYRNLRNRAIGVRSVRFHDRIDWKA